MNKLNTRRIIKESLLLLLGIKLIGFLVEPLFQLIKTGSKDVFLESLYNLFGIRRIIGSLLVAVAITIYNEKTRQKKIDQKANEGEDA